MLNRIRFVLLVTLFYTLQMCGQVNLAPNPSFESNASCPFTVGDFEATSWYSPTVMTPDHFDTCNNAINGFVGVPENVVGHQYARTGHGYAGLGVYASASPNVRDYIQAQLLDTLVSGVSYCVSFWMSLADSSRVGIDHIGAYLSAQPINCSTSGCYLSYSSSTTNLDSIPVIDTSNWVFVSGIYIATGGESYITIGNFTSDVNCTTQLANSSATYNSAYYYIDDVRITALHSVVTGTNSVDSICIGDSLFLGASSWPDVTYTWSPLDGLSNGLISNPAASPSVTTTYTLSQTECGVTQTATVTVIIRANCDTPSVFFIPTVINGNQKLEISDLSENSHLTVYDMRGRRVYYSENYQNDFRGDSVAEGQYIVELVTSEGDRFKQKLVVTR